MALSSAALTTLAKVKGILGTTDGSQDARLEALIEAASEAAARYCSRQFHRTDGIVEDVPGFSSVYLRLQRAPVLAVSSVKYADTEIDSSAWLIDDAATGFLYAPNGWTWTAANSAHGTVAKGIPGTERKRYEITYDGGYVTPNQVDLAEFATRTLPYDLEEAICQMVTDSYQSASRDSSIAAEKLLTGAVTYAADRMAISAHSRSVLDMYSVVVMG